MRLGFINFADLALLLWKSNTHFRPFQDFLKDYLVTIYKEQHRIGVISGCELTAPGGLTVRTAAGVVLFDNDELVKVEQIDTLLLAADLGDPRLDRLELVFTTENNIQVTNTAGGDVQFDKLQTGTPTQKNGVPAPVPAVPAKTPGTLSLGIISVAQGQLNLTAVDINQNDVARDKSYVVDNSLRVEDILVNAPGGTKLRTMVVDKSRHRKKVFDYIIHRKTDTAASGIGVPGQLILTLNPETNNWDMFDDQISDVESGVTFGHNPITGEVEYDSVNIAGVNYIGKIHHTSTVVDL